MEKFGLELGEYNGETDTYPVLDGLTAEDYIAFPDDSLKAGMACITYDDATWLILEASGLVLSSSLR